MSSLPTLDDLQARARQPPGCHPEKKSQQQTIPVVVTPTTIIQEREARQSTTQKIYRKCATVFQCSRSKTELPTYSQLHRGSTGSSLLSVASNFPEPWRRRVVLLVVAVVVSTMVFWAVLFWKMQHAQSTSDYQKDYERRPGHSWYRDAMFYEIFPASFQDTDSDGYGDFKGIIQHLDYIVHLGAKAIRLNSIFSALDYPLEYEHVIDLRTHDPHLGRGSWDFGLLVREAHGRGLRVVLEFNPCVTSDQHTWALHWQRGIPGYEHFYASHNSSKAAPEIENSEGPPPEDWELTQRTFGGHYIVNWSNPLVQEEYRKALVHWIELGVDGIYMKHLENMHVINKKDILGIIQQWREVLDKPKRPGQLWSSRRHQTILEDCDSTTDQKTSVENTEKELLDSTYPTKALYQETSSNRDSEKDSIGVSDLSNILQKDKDPKKTDHTSSQCLGKMILIVSSKFADELTKRFGKESETLKTILKNIDVLDHPILVGSGEEMGQQVSSLGQLSSWQEFGSPVPMFHLGSSDTFRVASRIEPRYQMAAFYLLMSLPGATSVFYGDEIGMKDSFDVANGRVYRGGQLTPMQWTSDNSTCGGFTDNATEPWIPLNPEHLTTNVELRQKRLQEFIHLSNYRKNILKHYSSQDLRFDVLEPNVVVLERTHKMHKFKKVLLAANFGSMSEEKEFPKALGNIKAALTTPGPTRTRVRSKGFTISPGAAFIAEVTLQHNSSPVARRD